MTQQNGILLLFKQIVVSSNLILLVTALFCLILQRYWIGDLIGNFRLQYLIASLVIAVLLIIFRKYMQLFLCLLAIVINGAYVIPLFFSWGTPLDQKHNHNLQLTTINVNAHNNNYALIKYTLMKNNSDIIVLEEVRMALYEQLHTLRDIYPFIVPAHSRSYSPIVMLSKIPPIDSRIYYIGPKRSLVLLTTFKIGSQLIRVLGLHLYNPILPRWFEIRNAQYNDLLNIILNVHHPLIVAGDFNTTPWSYYFRRFLKLTGLVNTMNGFGPRITWRCRNFLCSIPIDFILTTPNFKTNSLSVGRYMGSDHYPVTAIVSISDNVAGERYIQT